MWRFLADRLRMNELPDGLLAEALITTPKET
jgi:hypothetical protein